MDIACPFCKALHWKAESSGRGSDGQHVFESCCKKGAVVLDPLPTPPPLLRDLFSSNSSPAKRFRSNIRHFNAALSYTSFTYTADRQLRPQEHTYIFQLQGAIYHWQGPLRGSNPSYSQLYFLDPTEATNIRFANNPSLALDRSLLSDLDHLFRSENPFSHMFRRARDVLDENPGLSSLRLNPQLRLITTQNDDPRRYNLPTVNYELAAVIPDISSEFRQ
jgi:hypothetical protein